MPRLHFSSPAYCSQKAKKGNEKLREQEPEQRKINVHTRKEKDWDAAKNVVVTDNSRVCRLHKTSCAGSAWLKARWVASETVSRQSRGQRTHATVHREAEATLVRFRHFDVTAVHKTCDCTLNNTD